MVLERKNLIVLNIDWDAVVKTFPERSVDTVVIADVIEHLTKEDGKLLLALTENPYDASSIMLN